MLRQKSAGSHGSQKAETLRRALEAPQPLEQSHSYVTPKQNLLGLYIPPPLPQCLLFPIRINHPLLCPLCKAPLSPGIQCPALVLQPPQPDWKPLQGRDGWRVCISIYALVPIQEPGAQGAGKPPQLPTSDDPTLLPTWTPPGLEGALTLRQPVLGTLAPRLP